MNQINSTPDGKLYNFLSPLSMIPGVGPDWKGSVAEDTAGPAAKFAVYKFFEGASQSMVRTPFGSMSGAVAGTMEFAGQLTLKVLMAGGPVISRKGRPRGTTSCAPFIAQFAMSGRWVKIVAGRG